MFVAPLEKDYVIEGGVKLSDGRVLTYKHVESSFSNPNLSMAIHTLDWLCESARWIRDYEDELEAADGKDSAGRVTRRRTTTMMMR